MVYKTNYALINRTLGVVEVTSRSQRLSTVGLGRNDDDADPLTAQTILSSILSQVDTSRTSLVEYADLRRICVPIISRGLVAASWSVRWN